VIHCHSKVFMVQTTRFHILIWNQGPYSVCGSVPFSVICHFFVYYESTKRDLKIRPIYECRCDERLQTKVKEFTRLVYTGLLGGLGHLRIETRLVNEKIVNTLSEYVT